MRPELSETATRLRPRGEPRRRVPPEDHAGCRGLVRQAAGAENPAVEVYWWQDLSGPFHHALLDPATGERSKVRETRGGDFLYRFHFELNLPPIWGRWIVSACAMVLLIALISGIVTHRRIFADFFTFRRDRSAQRGWLDAHNVAGVLALPFHLMIVYTGLVTLAPMLMPWGGPDRYRGDGQRYYAKAGIMRRAARRGPARRGPAARRDRVAGARLGRRRRPNSWWFTSRAMRGHRDGVSSTEPPGLAHLHPQIAYGAIPARRSGASERPARPPGPAPR